MHPNTPEIADDRVADRGSQIADDRKESCFHVIAEIASDRRADCCTHFGQRKCQNYTRVVRSASEKIAANNMADVEGAIKFSLVFVNRFWHSLGTSGPDLEGAFFCLQPVTVCWSSTPWALLSSHLNAIPRQETTYIKVSSCTFC